MRTLAERCVDRFRRHLPKGQDVRPGGRAARISVATGAMSFELDGALRSLGLRGDCEEKHCNQAYQDQGESFHLKNPPTSKYLGCAFSCLIIYARLMRVTMRGFFFSGTTRNVINQ